jgi:hypothetical protein
MAWRPLHLNGLPSIQQIQPDERRATDLAGLMPDVAENYRTAAEASRLTLDIDARPDLPRVARVREILGHPTVRSRPGEGATFTL